MDSKMLNKLAQTKERTKAILDLRKAGKKDPTKYDEIFENYGQTIYNIAVPSKHREAEIKKLIQEGRFEDIYRKHGNRAYKDNIYKMQQIDVYNETGSKPRSILNRIGNVIKHRIAPVFLSTLLLAPPTVGATAEYARQEETRKNAIEYAQEIEDYDREITDYAKQVKSMNLSHVQIFTKVMYDMWDKIDGYSEDVDSLTGYLRINLNEEGQGVCRHFADDTTARLNAINPEYNARNVVVYMSENEYRKANIQRTIYHVNSTVTGTENEDKKGGVNFEKVATKIFGNHAVTVVDIPGENVSLVLDPTNVSMGVFKDGKIYMFSTPDGKGLETKPAGNFVLSGFEKNLELAGTELESFLVSNKTLEELRKEYGIEAQNEALEYLANLRGETDYNKKDFSDIIKVKDKEVLDKIEEEGRKASEKQSESIQMQELEERSVE